MQNLGPLQIPLPGIEMVLAWAGVHSYAVFTEVDGIALIRDGVVAWTTPSLLKSSVETGKLQAFEGGVPLVPDNGFMPTVTEVERVQMVLPSSTIGYKMGSRGVEVWTTDGGHDFWTWSEVQACVLIGDFC